MKIQAPKGTKDVLPEESYIWQYVESKFRQICKLYGYQEVRFPTFEYTELFQRGVGETTDIVQKEMYTFLDKGGRSITLRPEGTASVARLFIEHGFASRPMPQRLYYIISAFRYENTQGGRYREFHQFGIENFGSKSPVTDAEIISLSYNFFVSLGLDNIVVNINSIGCPVCRKDYVKNLKEYFLGYYDKLCPTCKQRLDKNPMRILDCKEDNCKLIAQDAPKPIEYLCDECKTHFEALKGYLDAAGVCYKVDPYIVRGLDYYTRTVFEIVDVVLDKELAICGGGRYDNLIEQIGGSSTPGIGFAIGVERLIMLLSQKGLIPQKPQVPQVFIATLGDLATKKAFEIASTLRFEGISTVIEELSRSLKSQMKYADKLGCDFAVIIGDDELEKGVCKVREMKTSSEEVVRIEGLAQHIKSKI
ncbi:histidyl-tRNA synthetase [Caldicellulosiruptor saccharolyticus DSM 8903]|uniref:Histidine--tRNA ligase n=1 Tax=Caldicellulosiruptor saccharolyticus (strain ATCC 43494 / DSM 8903 / Tp8T 6331) TaxID=351627 RepID=SYH_CALS8|nr:histidine--tRNA ligase [Caldicellulosiruptor saccharolyticus]A4XHB0.1 RecName: Full=Histidine--tRNA ligase; AltName: Full=Histidyl-tRNA synthetase; Short=HisRS [Caldicellulosiruptor saccharolyticus DSM 8903]ABP66295.1 histidyl-tRNA synthetase [Caldicellulosiruptor saccharolyticus DSM 8903]